MSRYNRGIRQHSRAHHGPQAALGSLFLDGNTWPNFQNVNGYTYQSTHESISHTALLWRLKDSFHLNNNNLMFDWASEPILSQFGETEMSCAFWVKLHPNGNNTNSIPVEHPSNANSDTWRVIWYPGNAGTSSYQNIWVAVAYDGSAKKNYIMMGAGGGTTGQSGKKHRVGTTTEIADASPGADDYTADWIHIACVWNTANPTDWEMWVNGVEQTNAFDSSNPFYRGNELKAYAYCPIANASPGYPFAGPAAGGGFGRRLSSYQSFNIVDFGYWHAALTDSDVSALWNNGVLSTRSAPTQIFASSW